jgi:hypothetical protein
MARFENGWVKIHRKLLFDPQFDPIDRQIIIWLVVAANVQESYVKPKGSSTAIKLTRGQVLTCIDEISRENRIGKKTVISRLKGLIEMNVIELKKTNRSKKSGTIITICNYNKYQSSKSEEEKQKGNKSEIEGSIEGEMKVTLEGTLECSRIEELRIKEVKKLRIKNNIALASATPSPPNELIAYYCEKFKQRYGRNPVIVGREAGAAKTILKSMSFEKAKQAVDGYFEISDPWLVQRMHPLSTLQEPSMMNKAMAKEPLTVGNIEKLRKTNPFFEGIGETIIEVEGIKNVSK